jgi:hypothetical protein
MVRHHTKGRRTPVQRGGDVVAEGPAGGRILDGRTAPATSLPDVGLLSNNLIRRNLLAQLLSAGLSVLVLAAHDGQLAAHRLRNYPFRQTRPTCDQGPASAAARRRAAGTELCMH